MGDSLLKNKQKLMLEPTMLRRPWPPMYRGPTTPPNKNTPAQYTNAYRSSDSDWRDYSSYGYTSASTNSVHSASPGYQQPKGRDYYFLAPYYRNAMPPPPNMANVVPQKRDQRLLMVDPASRRRSNSSSNGSSKKLDVKVNGKALCHCSNKKTVRSRSMDDVRSEMIEINSEWEPDENGNNNMVANNNLLNNVKDKKLGRNNKCNNKFLKDNVYARRSVENLLVDTSYSPPPPFLTSIHGNGDVRNGRKNGFLKVKLKKWTISNLF